MQTWEKSRIILTGCEVFGPSINLTIFGQHSKNENLIDDLAAKIKSCIVNLETLNYASIGHQCLAKYAKDGEWYRAVIKSCTGNSCIVEFIDYGHHQVTACQDLKCMPAVFANVEPQCHAFSLQAEGESTCGHWTMLVAEQVSKEFMYCELEIEVCAFKDGSMIAKSPDISKFLLDRGFMSLRAEIAGPTQQCHLSVRKFSLRQKLNVSIGAVLPDGSFFCHDLGMEDRLNRLLDDLYDTYSEANARPLAGASKGQYCCANFSEDGNWYRAQILEMNGSDATVRFIDYGNTEKCDISSLLTLHPKFMELPVQGIHCVLSGALRQQEMVKILNDLVDKCVKVEFVNIDLNPFPVRLYYNGELVGLTSPSKTKNVSHNSLVTMDKLAVPINTEIPIRITHVEDPGKLWVQLIDLQAQMIRLTGALTSIYNSAPADTYRLPRVEKGLLCCVKSQRSRNWCRGQVAFVCNDSVEVKFVDFGHTELTHASNLKPLAVEYQRLPHFAIPCALDNVGSVAGKWCDASVEYLKEYVAKSGVTAKFTAKHEELYSAQVFVSSKSDKLLLNKEIVEKGLGKWATATDGGVLVEKSPPSQGLRSPRVISRQYYSSHGVSRVGDQVLVSICANPTPEEFWVFPLSNHLQHTFRRLEEELSCYLHIPPSAFSDIYRGMPCIYLSGKEALRASVLSLSDLSFVEVMLVDLGQKKRVSVTSLRPIQSSHLSLGPPLAIRCTMNGIVESKSKFWSPSAMEAFSRFRMENTKDVVCTVHACVTDGVSELFMARISTPFKDFADILVETGNCRYVEPFGNIPFPYSIKSYLYGGPGGIVGKEETYYVTHVERADLFYCQLSNEFDVIDDFMDKVQNHCRSRKTHGTALQDLARTTLCFVEYDEKWYRAHFMSAAPLRDVNHAVVFLVDYGNVITVPLDDVMLFDQNSDLAQTPMHAVPCSLSEIRTQIQDREKAEKTVSKLEDMILNKEFRSLITGSTNGKLHLDLFTDTSQRTRINSAFGDEISPRPESIVTVPKNDNDPLLKGNYREIQNIEPKSCHSVTIAHINNPDDFYIRLDANRDVFEMCCKEVDGFYTAQRRQDYQVTSLRKNDIVCVKHPVTFAWRRGVISDINDAKPDTALVEFVDFGNKESVSISSSTKKLSANMQLWPRFAIHCRLKNIRPVGEKWTVGNEKHFEDLCRSAACRLRFNTLDVTENKWAVDLKIDGKSVSRMMVASNQASFVVSPSSNPSSSQEQVQTKRIDSMKIGDVKTVYISHVESIDEVYLQPCETQEALEAMMESINGAAENYSSVTQPNGTCSYLCRYCEDGRLYRANIVSVEDDGKIKIIFSDYGNCSLVNSDELRVMPKRFSALPEQAIKCEVQCSLHVDTKEAVSKLEDLSVEESVSISACCMDVSSSTMKVSLTLRNQDGSETDFVDFFGGRDVQQTKSHLPTSYSKLDVETGKNLKAYVSQVDGPSEVWLQLSSNTTDLDNLMEEIERHCTPAQNISKPASLTSGTPCLAKYVVDGGWYRGTVVESDVDTAKVLFVDYGNKETVNVEDILSVNDKFLVLPQQAVECRLRNVRGLSDWKAEDTVKLVQRVSDVELDACFHQSESCPGAYDVDLIYPCGTSLNEEWNETLDSRLAAADSCTISSLSDQSVRGKHVVTDRGDHVIVENVLPVPKLDFSSSGHERSDDRKSNATVTNISIEMGASEDGYVSYCDNPGLFYVQLSRYEPTMDRIYDEIAKILGSEQSADARVDVGTLCIAKSPDDGEWYRARCTDVVDSKLSVWFVDYGNTAEVLHSDTRPVSADLASFPMLAVRCRLHDLVLLGESWKIVTDTFLDMTLDQDLKITFVSKDGRGCHDVTLMLSDEDVCNRIVIKHGDVVTHGKPVEMEITTVGGNDSSFLFERGSFWCVRIIYVDESNNRFHALNLAVPNGRLQDTITRCLQDRSERNEVDYVTLTDLEASSLYLKRYGENWHCIKVLAIDNEEACVLDLNEGKWDRAGRGDELLCCSSDVRRVAENMLLSCALPAGFNGEAMRENIFFAVELKSQDDRGDWIVDLLRVESVGNSAFASAETTVASVSNTSSALSKFEESNTREWAETHVADITRFCEIGGEMMQDCPESIRNYLEQVLLLKLIIPSVSDCEKQINVDGGKRPGYERRQEVTPAKKMKLESELKRERADAIMWEFDVGDTFEAIIAGLKNPGKIFLRPYLLISESTNAHRPVGDADDKTERILADKFCLVRTYDGISNVDHWVRAEVLGKDGDSFLINDLETGVNFQGAVENIIPVGESLLGWPAFCMECSLAGVKPVNGADSWNATPTAELKSFVHGFNVSDVVEVKIVAVRDGCDGKVFEVDIFVNSESLSKRLIALNVASAVDKENADRDSRKTFDGLNRGKCRMPFKEITQLRESNRPSTKGAESSDCAANSLPTFDLLAVPWKVVRTSLKGSFAESLSDSVFVYEAEELLLPNAGTHGKRQLSSFKIYRSNTVSEAFGSGAGKNCVVNSTDEERRDRGALEKSTISLDSSLLNLLTPPDDVNQNQDSTSSVEGNNARKFDDLNLSPTRVNDGDQAECSEDPRACDLSYDEQRDKRADELAKELVDRILTDLSDEALESDSHDHTSSSSNTVDICVVDVHPYQGSSDGSRTVVDDDNVPESAVEDTVIHDESNLPVRTEAVQQDDGIDVSDEVPHWYGHCIEITTTDRHDEVTSPGESGQVLDRDSEGDRNDPGDRDDCSTDTMSGNYVDCREVKNDGEESYEEDRDRGLADCNENKSLDAYLTAEENVDSIAQSEPSTDSEIEQQISAVCQENVAEPDNCRMLERENPVKDGRSGVEPAAEQPVNDGMCPVSETRPSPFLVPLPSDSDDEFSLSEDRHANLKVGSRSGLDSDSKEVDCDKGSLPNFEKNVDAVNDAPNELSDVPHHVPSDASGQLVNYPSLSKDNVTEAVDIVVNVTDIVDSTGSTCDSGVPAIETGSDKYDTTSTKCEEIHPVEQDQSELDENPTSSPVSAESCHETQSISSDSTDSANANAMILSEKGSSLDNSLSLLVGTDSCSGSHGHKEFGMCCLPKMQLEMGELADVCFVKTGTAPLTVVLQFDTGWESSELRQLMKNTNSAKCALRLQTCDYFETDTVCLAVCSDASFERARILDLKNDTALVELIDHGETFSLHKEKLHKLPEELSVYPRQSAECRLHGLEIVPDYRTTQDIWNQIIAPLLYEVLEGKSLKAEIRNVGDDSELLPGVKIMILEDEDCWQVLSELLLAEGLVKCAGDHEQTSTDAEWTTINDSSYEELVKGSDTSVVMHSSNANLSIIEDAFEEDLPEIVPEKKSMRDVTDGDVRNAAENISTNALSDALVIAKFGFNDIVGSPCSMNNTFEKNQSGECHTA